ncbi:MAG: methyltransferase domain-containing protein [Chloroflexota bacterium]|nr:methyltransferase domain-containing protein [Chloroflexota bacterium]
MRGERLRIVTIPADAPEARDAFGRRLQLEIEVSDGGNTFSTNQSSAGHFPFDSARFCVIEAVDVLEHVVDEQAFLTELARLIAPDGLFRLRTPHAGVLEWLDAENIFRYIGDVTGRVSDLPERGPIAWHRHYRELELRELLTTAGFEIASVRRIGIGVRALLQLGLMILFRLVLPRRRLYDRLLRVVNRGTTWERLVPAGRFGSTIVVQAIRR